MTTEIEVPASLADLLTAPDRDTRIANAFALLRSLGALRVQITRPSTVGVNSLVFSAQGAVLSLGLQLPAPIPDSDGTTAGNSATLNLLLAGLRDITQLPR